MTTFARFIPIALTLTALTAFALPAHADRASLIAQMEANGSNEYLDERHAVEVNGCIVTTYRWRNVERGWVLWTSLTLDMTTVKLDSYETDGEKKNYGVALTDPPLAIMTFSAKAEDPIRHEKPFDRKLPEKWVPSPRGDGSTHFFEDQLSVAIIQQGPDVAAKAKAFTDAWVLYRQEYCTFLG